MEGYEKLYDKIQDVTNEMNRFFGLAILNSVPMDEHTKELVEKMENLSRELSETSHELEEHLAWDNNKNPLSRKEIIDSKILIGVDITKIKGILGYWWVCSNNYISPFTGSGVYTFNRAGHGRLEVYTQFQQDNKGGYSNLVVDVR
jgi:hypothetical protein